MNPVQALTQLLNQPRPARTPVRGRPRKLPKQRNNDILSRLTNNGKSVPQNPPTYVPGENY